tara:strand:+ start:65 stop:172 length:108 start_codon:yes stop_codon:yes gene_type:complete
LLAEKNIIKINKANIGNNLIPKTYSKKEERGSNTQ